MDTHAASNGLQMRSAPVPAARRRRASRRDASAPITFFPAIAGKKVQDSVQCLTALCFAGGASVTVTVVLALELPAPLVAVRW
jgi:hypothetical protein